MKHILIFAALICSLLGYGQVRMYNGFIDATPIQMVTYSYSDGDIRGIYAYNAYDSPIIINGHLKNDSLVLREDCKEGQATWEFVNYHPENNELTATWRQEATHTTHTITLTKQYEFDSYDTTTFEKREMMQCEATDKHYFKILLTHAPHESIDVVGVRIYEKGTDSLLQEIPLECQFWGLQNVSVNDYNFDGIEDFSVFEASYAGPNTSSIYILRNPKAGNYFVSEIGGISLSFDHEKKRIYEHNQCCAGRSHMMATYKLVKNKMVQIEQNCMEYDDETEEFKDVDCD